MSGRSSASGIDEEAALEAFRDPLLGAKHALFDLHTRRLDHQVPPATAAAADQRPDLPAGLPTGHHLKARQLGFSTLLGVVWADRLCFGTGATATRYAVAIDQQGDKSGRHLDSGGLFA